MVNAINKARAKAKSCLEDTYGGICTVIERQTVKDAFTKIRHQEEMAVLENQPCRLSFEKASAAAQTETAAAVTQGVKLFLPPEIMVKPGSKVIVKQNGTCGVYKASGEPAVYQTHQEIMLELFKEWAQ